MLIPCKNKCLVYFKTVLGEGVEQEGGYLGVKCVGLWLGEFAVKDGAY